MCENIHNIFMRFVTAIDVRAKDVDSVFLCVCVFTVYP
jgi:hypothetical protein